MIFCDVNLLLYAHRRGVPEHAASRAWLSSVLASDQPYGLSGHVLSAFIRIATHHRVFNPPSTMAEALAFAAEVRDRPNRVALEPGDRHWEIFVELCSEPGVKGPLVADAFLAAIAIEHGCVLATADGDFKRFVPRLEVFNPLAADR